MNKVTEVKQYTVYLPTEKHVALKLIAVKRNIPISSLLLELINAFLKKEEQESPF